MTGGKDLSQDESTDQESEAQLIDPAPAMKINTELERYKDEWSQKQTVINSALALAASMYMTAIGVVLFGISCVFGNSSNGDHLWKLGVLTAGFLLAPTIIIGVIIKSIYSSKSDDKKIEGAFEQHLSTIKSFIDFTKDIK